MDDGEVRTHKNAHTYSHSTSTQIFQQSAHTRVGDLWSEANSPHSFLHSITTPACNYSIHGSPQQAEFAITWNKAYARGHRAG